MSSDNKPVQVILCGGGLDTMATLTWLSETWHGRELRHNPHETAYEVGPQILHPNDSETILLGIDYGQVAWTEEWMAIQAARHELFHDLPVSAQYHADFDYIKPWNNGKGLLFGTGGESKLVGRNLGLVLAALNSVTDPMPLAHVMLCLTQEVDQPMPQDTTISFVNNLSNVLRMSGMVERVSAPLIGVEKGRAIEMAYRAWPGIFDTAFSCWVPDENGACGECRHCQRLDYFKAMVMRRAA